MFDNYTTGRGEKNKGLFIFLVNQLFSINGIDYKQ